MFTYTTMVRLWYYFAFAPLRVIRGNMVEFVWSWFPHGLVYILFLTINILYLCYLLGIIVVTLLEKGFVHFLFMAITVYASQVVVVYAKLVLLIKGRSLAWFLCKCWSIWSPLHKVARLSVTKRAFGFGALWLFNSLVLASSAFWLQPKSLGEEIFILYPLKLIFPWLSSVSGPVGNLHMAFLLFEYTLATLLLDVFPLILSLKVSTVMAVINEEVVRMLKLDVRPDFELTESLDVSKSISNMDNGWMNERMPSSNSNDVQWQCSSLRELIGLHDKVVGRTVYLFNSMFGGPIAFSLKIIFAMCLFLSYLSVTTGLTQGPVFFLNTIQFLMRATILLLKFGDVKHRAAELHQLLHLAAPKLKELCRVDEELQYDLDHLKSALQSMAITAGSYYSYSHALLLSFYGFLFTYLTILIQSL